MRRSEQAGTGELDRAGHTRKIARQLPRGRDVPIRLHIAPGRACGCGLPVDVDRGARAAGTVRRHRPDPRFARPDRSRLEGRAPRRAFAHRIVAADPPAARPDARQAGRSRAAACRHRRAAEGPRPRAGPGRGARLPDRAAARAAACQRAELDAAIKQVQRRPAPTSSRMRCRSGAVRPAETVPPLAIIDPSSGANVAAAPDYGNRLVRRLNGSPCEGRGRAHLRLPRAHRTAISRSTGTLAAPARGGQPRRGATAPAAWWPSPAVCSPRRSRPRRARAAHRST